MSEAILCALIIALVMILGPLIWPVRSQGRAAYLPPAEDARLMRARARHPAGRKADHGSGVMWAELDALEMHGPGGWDRLAAEAESFSADKDSQGDR